MLLDISIIIAFLIANLIIGIYASQKTKSLDHFSVGHRSFSTFAIFATLSASFIGGGYTIGNASKVYTSGLFYAFALLGFSLKEILVAKLIAPRMDNYRDCLSIGDIMQKRYGVNAKIITGVFAMIICAGILGAQVGAMGTIFNLFFHIPPVWGIVIGFGIIIFYSSVGGMRAVVHTDILQFLILVIGIPLSFFIGLHYIGGWGAITQTVPTKHINFIQNSHDLFVFIALFITFIFGETLVPPYVQRLFMAKTSEHTERGTLLSGLLSIPFFIIVGAIGLIAYVLNQNIEPNTALPYVVQTVLPVGVRGFVIAGILSVIMSSAAGFLNSAAVSFVNDIVKPIRKDELNSNTLLWLARVSTIVVGLIAIVFALAIHNILDILLYAYNFWAPIILVPLVAVIFGVPANKRDFYFGALCGIITAVIWTQILKQPGDINAVVPGLLGNFIGFTTSFFTRPNSLADELV